MTTFRFFFLLEFERLFFSLRNWIVLIVFLLLCIFLVNTGIRNNNDIEKEKETFRELERNKVEQIVNWDQYGAYGFRLYFMPGSMSALFYNSSHFTELTCRIDSGEKLNIYQLFKGKKVFEEKPGKSMDFSGIILILGSFMSLFYGFDAFRHQEYIKFLSSLYGHHQTFIYIWLSRVILLCVFFTGVTLLAVVFLIIKNVEISSGGLAPFLVFSLVMLMMQVFFFTLGTLTSSIKSRLFAGLLIIIAWIFSVYIIPAGMNKIVEAEAKKMPSYYQVELNKLKVLMSFEKKERDDSTKLQKQLDLIAGLNEDIGGKKIKTSDDFWKRIDELKRKEPITQHEKDILGEIDKLKEKESDLTIDEIKKETGKIHRRLYEEWGRWVNDQPIRARELLKEKIPDIQAFDSDLLGSMKSNIDFSQWIFSLYPTAFYLSTGNEVSGRGYANIITFYDKAIEIKKEFMGFYVKNRYELDPNNENIVNFIEHFKEKEKGEKEANIFYAESALPWLYGLGLLTSSMWIAVVFILSYGFYRRRALFLLPKKKIIGLDDLDINLNRKSTHVVVSTVRGKELSDHLYNVLSGKNKERGFTGKVTYDDVQLDNQKVRENGLEFVYLCQPEEIPPDIKVGMLVSFFRRTLKLEKDQLTEISPNKFKIDVENFKRMYLNEVPIEILGLILMEIARLRKSKVYLIYSFTDRMASDYRHEIIEQIEKLKKEQEGVSILYITNELSIAQRIGDYISVLKKESAY